MCKHTHDTLITHTDPEVGTFTAYQCDDCGILLQRHADPDVTSLLPILDLPTYQKAVERRVCLLLDATTESQELAAQKFFHMAAKGGHRG